MKIFLFIIVIFFCVEIASAFNPPPTQTTFSKLPNYPGTLPTSQTTGFLSSSNASVAASESAYLFYWFVPSLNNPKTDPLLVWLSGGPGCSSSLSYFYEIGPLRITGSGASGDTVLSLAPYTWARNASLLFIDSPVGTGFSFLADPLRGGYSRNEEQVADALYFFLNRWFALFPQYQENRFFISAESYGGHYAPALATRINAGNTDNNPGTLFMNLQGISIGNGMTDPYKQYGSYAPFALGRGLIDGVLYQQLQLQYQKCAAAIDAGKLPDENSECQTIIEQITQAGGPFNNYDVTKTCLPNQPLCYDFDPVGVYLNRPDVQAVLGVNEKWSICNNVVYEFMVGDGDWWSNQQIEIPPLLANNQRVLVYGGTNDFIVNFLGSELWVRDLVWPGQSQYQNAPRAVWTVNSLIAGYSLEYQALSMVSVINAGHMVPMDQPANAYDLFLRFTQNRTFTNPSTVPPYQ